MSFLFCSWAKNEEEVEKEEEDEEEEDKESVAYLKDAEKIYNEALKKKSEPASVSPVKQPTEELQPLRNGNSKPPEEEKDKPFFVMWKRPEEEESENEECDEEINERLKTSPLPSPVKETREKTLPDNPTVLEEKSITENGGEEKSSSMFAHVVWKDPNKEDEYITSSSSEEEEEEDLASNQEDSMVNNDDENELKTCDSKTDKHNGHGENTKKDYDDDDDIFDSIAKSVTKSMTTLFCDYDDFDIKPVVSDDDTNNDVGFEMNGRDYHEERKRQRSLSSGVRSRSGSVKSQRSQSNTDSDTGARRTSTREKKPKKNYDLLSPTKFSKPKPVTKYFDDPSIFLDKNLYKTHRCDIKIKNMKLQVNDWDSILPPRRKRRVEDADEMPLSKRKKLTPLSKPARPRGTDSITKRSQGLVSDGKYHSVCKFVRRQCPLCWNFWNCSQPFGQHVINQTCQKTDITTPRDDSSMATLGEMTFLSVNTANIKTDSYVETSHVPSLKLLCRGSMVGKNSTSDVPMPVKEGLELYHSLVLPGRGGESRFWAFLAKTGRITLVSSLREYERLCRDPLKIAIYLEKKISRSRAKYGAKHSNTANWVEKYNFFLKLPLHDLFLSITKDKFRVLEAPSDGKICLICLVCNKMTCSGCQQAKKSKETRNTEMVKKVKKKKPSKKKVDTKKHKNNHQMDKKKGKAVIPPLKLKLSPHKSGHGQKYLIQKSDQKSRKARTRIALP